MALTRTFYAKDRAEWQAWLETNHTLETEIWLLFYKRHTGKPRVAYPDAVEEALCFGWIDSTIRRVDDATYAQRFTPRRPGSSWSELNKRRVARLVQQGRMTKTGLAKADFALPDPDSPRPLGRSSSSQIGSRRRSGCLRRRGRASAGFRPPRGAT